MNTTKFLTKLEIIFVIIFLVSVILGQETETGLKCPPLKQTKNVKISCFIRKNSGDSNIKNILETDCGRSQSPGTFVKYKCKLNHIPLDGLKPNLEIDNELKCGPNGNWIGQSKYDDFSCKEDCGHLLANSKPLVVYGQASNRSQFPWHATIFRNTGSTWTYICGGSIIRNKIVLSAAHCFAIDHNRVHNPDDFRIVLGSVSSSYVENLIDGGAQVHKVQRIHISENYDPKKGFQADIALIQLKDNIEFNENVVPVCLPNDYTTDLQAIKSKSVAQVAGFGVTEDGKISRILRSLELKIKSSAECYSSLRRVLSESQFCGGNNNGTKWETVCNGDSGGGLFVSSTVHQKYFVHGIVSSGDPDTIAGVCKNYAVFTRIYPFVFWIRDVIEEISGEIARDLHENPPYPYALRGTETQIAHFSGLPREWVNRVTSLEVIHSTFSLDVMLDALENAKPIDSIILENIQLTNQIQENNNLTNQIPETSLSDRLSETQPSRIVVLPLISSFTFDLLWAFPGEMAFEKLAPDRTFPAEITPTYLRKLLFFDKGFESGDNWKVSSILDLDTDVDLVVNIFRLLRIRVSSGELTLQQTRVTNEILEGYLDDEVNLDFTLQRLFLHRCPVELQKLGQIQTLTEVVLDSVVPTNPINEPSDISVIFRNWTDLKVLVVNLRQLTPHAEINLGDLSPSLVHLSVSKILLQVSKNALTFQNLKTFCCLNCTMNFDLSQVFPNLKSAVVITPRVLPRLNLKSSYLTSIYLDIENGQDSLKRILEQAGIIAQKQMLATTVLLKRSDSTKPWNWTIPAQTERHHTFYDCTKQIHFWKSEEDYLALRRLKTFEKLAWESNIFRFVGGYNPYALESFKHIPGRLQRRLKRIHLEKVDIMPKVLTASLEHAGQLSSLTLTNVTLDLGGFRYELIRHKTLEIRLEKLDFRDFSFYYVLEYVNSQLVAAVIPFQHVGRFKFKQPPSNILYHLFTNVNALRLSANDSVVYVLDMQLGELRHFQKFFLKMVEHLPVGHVLTRMSRALKERYEVFQEGVLPSTWEFKGLHVITQDFASGFFKDGLLRVIGRTGILNLLLTRLGKFVTLHRSTSLTLSEKDKNPLNFPSILAISVNVNEAKIE